MNWQDPPTKRGAPPYLTQAFRQGLQDGWVTDSRHESLELAIAAANDLHIKFDRRVRVIDQDERVHFRRGSEKRKGRL